MRGGLLLCFGAAACSHVDLPTLPANLTPEQRVATYARYGASAHGMETTRTCRAGEGCSSDSVELIELADGTRVREADDLLPLLPADGPATVAARRVQHLHARQTWWKLTGLATAIAGGYMMVKSGDRDNVLWKVGLGVMLGGPMVSIGGWSLDERSVRSATAIVFANYNAALAARLSLCVNGLALVPCESSSPTAPLPPAIYDPAAGSLRQQ